MRTPREGWWYQGGRWCFPLSRQSQMVYTCAKPSALYSCQARFAAWGYGCLHTANNGGVHCLCSVRIPPPPPPHLTPSPRPIRALYAIFQRSERSDFPNQQEPGQLLSLAAKPWTRDLQPQTYQFWYTSAARVGLHAVGHISSGYGTGCRSMAFHYRLHATTPQ